MKGTKKEDIFSLLMIVFYSGNQLTSVTDAADTHLGFVDGNTMGNDYTYDENGNLIQDKNKGFTIEYNILNLPRKISKGGDSVVYT